MSLSSVTVAQGPADEDGLGDKGRVPFAKYNAAVTELYTALGATGSTAMTTPTVQASLGIAALANPTNLIGLSAVNGVATTGTRSDSTHALNQSIAPTWTGVHTFSARPAMNLGLTVAGGAFTSLGITDNATATALTIAAAGNVTINPPSSGVALTVNGFGTNIALFVNGNTSPAAAGFDSANVAGSYIAFYNSGNPYGYIGSAKVLSAGSLGDLSVRAVAQLNLCTSPSAVTRVVIGTAGNVTINPPDSGNALTVSGNANISGTLAVSGQSSLGNLTISSAPVNPTDAVRLSDLSGFANPTNLIGLAAVNGVATTHTRSDSVHALDQSIAPTWTGVHTHAALLKANLGLTVAGGPFISLGISDLAAQNALSISSAGNVTVSAPGSGTAITVNGIAQTGYTPSVLINAPTTASQSNGLQIVAGTNINDAPLVITTGLSGTKYNAFAMLGDGSWSFQRAGIIGTLGSSAAGNVTINAPTSGDALTVNGVVQTYTGSVAVSSTAIAMTTLPNVNPGAAYLVTLIQQTGVNDAINYCQCALVQTMGTNAKMITLGTTSTTTIISLSGLTVMGKCQYSPGAWKILRIG